MALSAAAAALNSGFQAGMVCKGSYTAAPSDTNDLPKPGVLMVMTDGDVSFVGADGVVDTWQGVRAGDQIPVLVTRVRATGTTAAVKVLVV